MEAVAGKAGEEVAWLTGVTLVDDRFTFAAIS